MKHQKIYLAALILSGAGLLLCAIGFAGMGFDFRRLSTEPPLEQKSYWTQNAVTRLVIDAENAAVRIGPSSDGQITVSYPESKSRTYEIDEQDGVLTVRAVSHLKWYQRFMNISFETPVVEILLPPETAADIEADTDNGKMELSGLAALGSLNCKTDNGAVKLTDIACCALTAESDNGAVTLEKVSCSSLSVESDNGRITLNGVSSAGKAECSSKNGKITAEELNCGELRASAANGKIILTRVTAAELVCKSNNGAIELERADSQRLDLESDNGRITGTLAGHEDDYTIDCSADNGSCSLPERQTGGTRTLRAHSDNGSIRLSFTE